MLRLLSIRNFVVVDALDVEFDAGFSVLTGETGAGKSILLDALGLLLGDRFELRQLRPGAERAELAAAFDLGARDGADGAAQAWLCAHELDAGPELLLRRVLDAQGRSRAWINGRPATLAQLAEVGALLLDLHGQHAHQALAGAEAQRELLDAFGKLAALAAEVAAAWRTWRDATDRRDAAAANARASAEERERLAERQHDLAALALVPGEWDELSAAQRRLANAAGLIDATTQASAALSEGDDSLATRVAQLIHRLTQAADLDPALAPVVDLVSPAAIQIDEAARALRDYQRRLDLDPAELARVEARLGAIHDMARKHRVRPDELQALQEATAQRLRELDQASDAVALAQAVEAALARYDALAHELGAGRAVAAKSLSKRVTATMHELAMAGGRLEIALNPESAPTSHGRESVEFRIATHPKQPVGPLARVASGGELARVALAIHVAASDVGDIPTLVFDEVDTGIGGPVAATVGRMLQTLGARRQVLCVTHLPQVAAHADHHYRVAKTGDGDQVSSELAQLATAARIDELARMLAGSAITSKTRAHAKELYEQHRRGGAA
ncbi:MAG TPA: DNA repair protein RecN [Ideonella sp.]|nr:DNA repair protein RecN [Ideonella sp.]